MENKRPVPGVDTPREDDIITQCAGGCGKWMVQSHPRHITGGARLNPKTSKLEEYGPLTPEEVAIEVARLEQGGSRCVSCGPPRQS
jgi:hypothetical protein